MGRMYSGQVLLGDDHYSEFSKEVIVFWELPGTVRFTITDGPEQHTVYIPTKERTHESWVDFFEAMRDLERDYNAARQRGEME